MLNTLTRYEPLSGTLEGLLDEFFAPAAARAPSAAAPALRVDVKETPEAYTLSADLPGVKKEDIHIEVESNVVTLSAETRREAEAKDGEKWLRVERAFGKAVRRLALPQEVDEARAEARFADGVLALTLPKKAPAATRRIEVH